MSKRSDIEALIQQYPQYKDVLFSRGYLVTDNSEVQQQEYPFYGLWQYDTVGKYRIFVHPQQTYYILRLDTVTLLLIGHAYNPFSMVKDENSLLATCGAAYKTGLENMFAVINEWTGIFCLFIFDDEVKIIQDCSGVKSVYYGNINGSTFIGSHAQMIADECGLKMDPSIEKLVSNKMYRVGNRYLPGDMSPFSEVKHLSANLYLTILPNGGYRKTRFYPTKELIPINNESDVSQGISDIYHILNNSIKLASEKWNDRYISLSGGMDSKTTLACTNGLYEKFGYFSFTSKDTEFVDAAAAHKMCQKIGLGHEIISIPMENSEVEDFDVLHKLIDHNDAYVRFLKDSEIRKQITLYRDARIGVELKSWISETVRVFMERKYGLKHPKVLSPRHFSIFQTRLFGSPALLHWCDAVYEKYIHDIGLSVPPFNYEHTDLYYWEFRMSSWGMMVITSLDMCHTVTFPWNNRQLLDKFLTLPREERKSDNIHRRIIKYANATLLDEEQIENKYFNNKRIWIEKLYYYYRTIFVRENRNAKR